MRQRGALFACLVLASACGSSHIEGTKVCRRYPTAFTEAGRAYTCTFDVRSLRCGDTSRFVVQEWLYIGSADFVMEAQAPNRILAQSRSFATLGMVVSSSNVSTDYAYDGSGRLLERRRRRMDVTGTRDLDLTTYSSWDALGRPTAGTISVQGDARPLSIRYDDSARRLDASNGESTTVDANGNVVREVVVYGLGPPGDGVDRQIQTTAEICL